jgi:hypothetical protein
VAQTFDLVALIEKKSVPKVLQRDCAKPSGEKKFRAAQNFLAFWFFSFTFA